MSRVQYANLQQVHELINILKKKYEITVNWTGTLYVGVTLAWNYQERNVTLSIPTCVKKLLIKYHYPNPKRAQHTPDNLNL